MIDRVEYHPQNDKRYPIWELYDELDRRIARVIPSFLTTAQTSQPDFQTLDGLAVYLDWQMTAMDLTNTAVYDTAVPIGWKGDSHRYPHDGDAMTVYDSKDFDVQKTIAGHIIHGDLIRQRARSRVEEAIRNFCLDWTR